MAAAESAARAASVRLDRGVQGHHDVVGYGPVEIRSADEKALPALGAQQEHANLAVLHASGVQKVGRAALAALDVGDVAVVGRTLDEGPVV